MRSRTLKTVKSCMSRALNAHALTARFAAGTIEASKASLTEIAHLEASIFMLPSKGSMYNLPQYLPLMLRASDRFLVDPHCPQLWLLVCDDFLYSCVVVDNETTSRSSD